MVKKRLPRSFFRLTPFAAVLLAIVFCASAVFAAGTATIGGNLYVGAAGPDGRPLFAPDTAPASGASVMVQDMETGDVVTYGAVSGNSWTASVPAPGEYVVMFVATGCDQTSREFSVQPGQNLSKDAYLPPLDLPAASLLVYSFKDDYINGEDDFPIDPPLNGVTFILTDEETGREVARGVSGSSPTLPPDGTPSDGYYYFTGLKPGKYEITVDMSSMPQAASGRGWYQTSSIEGGPGWEVDLYPGDPGTAIGVGGYLAWFSFIERLGQLPPSAGVGSISGVLKDADGNWFADEPFNPANPYVTPNDYVLNGLVVLSPNGNTGSTAPIATAEADPATGAFTFNNVPPGNYKLFITDLPLEYIWAEQQVTVPPDTPVTGVEVFAPRWFARVNGYVTDDKTGAPIAGAKVNLRLEDGSIWKEAFTDANGRYNFNELEEVEILGTVDVEPPAGYRGLRDVATNFSLMTRTIQWYTFNYRADLQLERIPPVTGDIAGFVFYDNVGPDSGEPTASARRWVNDGVYAPKDERTMHGVRVELLDASGNPVLDSLGNPVAASTGATDEASLIAQGWFQPYTWPPDEFGGVFKNNLPGYYEFRDLAPGPYKVRVVPPAGFSQAGAGEYDATVATGALAALNIGVSTQAPLAGEIEGGVFDDINLDSEPLSLLFDEKAPVTGAPVGFYDHLGYFLGSSSMGSSLCYGGSTVCPHAMPPTEKPEIERRLASGVHIFNGNDPALPGYNANYESFAFPYSFGQGKGRFEADWSLLPTAFNGLGVAMLANAQVMPANAPVINGITQLQASMPGYPEYVLAAADMGQGFAKIPFMLAATGAPAVTAPPKILYRVVGANFGDRQGFSTISVFGFKLQVQSWSDKQIDFLLPPNVIGGPVVVAGPTGISNPVRLGAAAAPAVETFMAARTVFVDASKTSQGKGTLANPYGTITEALNHLPSATPRFVVVAPGTYNERIRIAASNVILMGSGAQTTVIDGLKAPSGRGSVITIGSGGTGGGVSNVMISGFTIKGGSTQDGFGAGVFGDYGNDGVDINNSIISGNGGTYGGGIWLHKSNHNVNIWSNIIASNGNIEGYGGGISVNDEPAYGPASVEPDHTLDDHNPGPPPGNYFIYNNLVFHNYSPDYGGGISLYEVKDRLNISGNMIMENMSADHGGGIFFEDTGPVDIGGNLFLRNYASDDGGALCFEDVADDISKIKIYNNLFAENIADDRGENTARGGAVSFDDSLQAEVFDNTFAGNIVAGVYEPRGGAIDAERNGHEYASVAPGFSNPKIYNNIIWGNRRLKYAMPHRRGKEGGTDYRWGINYVWAPDSLHVDNPALQSEWQSQNNSESFSSVDHNVISGGYAKGAGNIDSDPMFRNSSGFNWHLSAGSPAIDAAPAASSAKTDLERLSRVPSANGNVEIGAFEFKLPQPHVLRIPTGILGAIKMPK